MKLQLGMYVKDGERQKKYIMIYVITYYLKHTKIWDMNIQIKL